MQVFRVVAALAIAVSSSALVPSAAHAQGGLFGSLKQKVKDKVQQRVDQATDSVANGISCTLGDNTCIAQARSAGKPVSVVDSKGQRVSSADSASAVNGAAVAAAPSNEGPTNVDIHNDFTPGTRVIAQTDFANATVGDFPRNMELVRGNLEIAGWNGKKFLRTTSSSEVAFPLPEVLPQMFTLEFDFKGGWQASVWFAGPDAPEGVGGSVSCAEDGQVSIDPKSGAPSASSIGDLSGQLIHCQIMADSNYVKGYINGHRAAQSPNAPLGRFNKIVFDLTASNETPAYLGNIRVAAGGRDMYDALKTDGRFTTHGILFATGSAAIDPASSSTLTQIGQMLQQHADLRLEIDGHTDNVGSTASNQKLSDERAAAVKQYLVSNFQLAATRLTSRGFGASKPVASNTTDDGRTQNRRVELVKM